jgi:diacylglycerol kinase (ATP)
VPNQSPIHLLVNPAAGSGRARHRIEQAYAALRTIGPVLLVESTAARDETRLAVEATQANARALVVLGGDGSISHAARGLIATRSRTPLAIFAAGTGNDFVKTLGTPSHDYLAMARRIAAGDSRAIDAAEMDGVSFVNVAGFGFDVEVLQRTLGPQYRWLRGTPRYVVTALGQLFRYPGIGASVSAWPRATSARWLMTVFANGRHFGGAFHIAPDATLSDGLLDVIGIANANPLQRAGLFARAMRGAHLSHRAVQSTRIAECVVEFTAPPQFQADGELHQASGCRVLVRCVPKALRVIA